MHIMKKESERMLLLVERIREVVVVVELVVVFDGELVGKIVTTTLSQLDALDSPLAFDG